MSRDGRTLAYESWKAAKTRCLNEKCRSYSDYGGRGITIATCWMEFKTFYADMGPRAEGMSLDRIDVDGNYEPGNCRWATAKEQARNTRANVRYAYQGVMKTLPEWAEAYGLPADVVKKRVKKLGWSLHRALNSSIGSWSPVRLSKGRDVDHWRQIITSTPSNKAAAAILGVTAKTVCHWRRNHCRVAPRFASNSPDT